MSHSDNINKLIQTHQRRLQILKEQKALEGAHVDPRILIEIEDIETEIKKLQVELKAIWDEEFKQTHPIQLWLDTNSKNIRIGLFSPTDRLVVHQSQIQAYGQVVGLPATGNYFIVAYIVTDIEYEQGGTPVDKYGYWRINSIHLGGMTHRLFFKVFSDESNRVIAISDNITIIRR